jgi:hypothetical protein
MWRRRHPEPAPEPPAAKATPSFVADAVEAYLAGRYLDHAEQAERPLHGWMALNRVAHADPPTLEEIAEAELPARAVPAWRHREQVLAQRLLAITDGDPDAIREIQTELLVPLELQLLDVHPAAERTLTASVDVALDALSAWCSHT